ncbi:lipopolysaccharide export system permease protein [Cyclonatronum proteinivorum]|uniref:Lipopolysaccharide export system permease protein n=1 Tax=Cyclonatronum proteinivorum TaxID=1457365 RepID=A0A345UK38_9BACT|nr:LptF/LptG family permease [Cyclonatronum proteinivorum]AXJ00840.1 lipopolysaccharide export system permease protein [Cyclonatronum proteinivorum]
MTRIDRFIFMRLLLATLMVLGVLVFIFIVIDFSENSDTFSDRGAELSEIWSRYYLNYIPEMIRLVSPVAVFVAVLLVAGQMSERLELTAIKGAGVSFYRFMVPFLLFATMVTGVLSYLDGFVIPGANDERFEFERQYLARGSDRIDRSRLFRQENEHTMLTVNYFDSRSAMGYHVRIFRFENDRVAEIVDASRMEWQPETEEWRLIRLERRLFTDEGIVRTSSHQADTTLTVLPQDMARSTNDIYRLTYPEIIDYIRSLERSGVGGVALPKVQFFGKLFYPFGTIVITLVGLGISTSNRRKGGRGVLLGTGLIVIFFYLIIMKIIEPFGASGQLDPLWAAAAPHLLFLLISFFLIWRTPK